MFLYTLQHKLQTLQKLRNLLHDVDVFVWDLDGTLYFNMELLDHLRKQWQTYYQQFPIAQSQLFDQLEKTGKDWFEIIQLGSPYTTKELILEIESMIDKTTFITHSKALAHFFGKKKFRHILFSNATHDQAIRVLKKLGIEAPEQTFECILALEELPDAKPHPSAYTVLTQQLATTPPQRVVYVGDSVRSDIQPAQQLGFKTIHICRSVTDTQTQADLSFTNEAELFALLNHLHLLSFLR